MPVSLTHAGLSLAAGSLTTLSPCVFPLLPLVAGGALQGHRLSPVALGLGMAGSFALIGVVIGAVGPALGIDSDHVPVFGAWLLIAMAIAYASRAGSLRARDRVMTHIGTIKRGFAALLGLMGVAILAGWDQAREARIVAWLPTSWVDLAVML